MSRGEKTKKNTKNSVSLLVFVSQATTSSRKKKNTLIFCDLLTLPLPPLLKRRVSNQKTSEHSTTDNTLARFRKKQHNLPKQTFLVCGSPIFLDKVKRLLGGVSVVGLTLVDSSDILHKWEKSSRRHTSRRAGTSVSAVTRSGTLVGVKNKRAGRGLHNCLASM